MNRRTIYLLFALLVIISLSSCGKNTETPIQLSQEYIYLSPEPTTLPGIVEVDNSVEWTTHTSNPSEHNPNSNHTDNNTIIEADIIPTALPITTPEAGGHVPNSTAFEQYQNMSGDEQLAFMESFDSVEAFVTWYNAAKAEYEAENPAIEIVGDVIDVSQLIGGTN